MGYDCLQRNDLREPPGGQQRRDFFRHRERANQRVATETARGGDADLIGRCLWSTPYTLVWSRVNQSLNRWLLAGSALLRCGLCHSSLRLGAVNPSLPLEVRQDEQSRHHEQARIGLGDARDAETNKAGLDRRVGGKQLRRCEPA